jgi:competence ComEA-like helix-hairpin-helix protein
MKLFSAGNGCDNRQSAHLMRTDKLIECGDAGQSRVQFFAFVIAVFIAVVFSGCFTTRCLRSEQPPRLTHTPVFRQEDVGVAGAVELESRINPNNASTASLVRLPQIGPSRAAAIIAYRESISRDDSSRAAFRSCDDLQKVKGVGPKTAENLRKWLKFE